MRIEELAQVDFTQNWLACTRLGAIQVIKKDSLFIRWIKTALQVLTWCVLDVYGHVKIKRVATGLFTHFKVDYRIDPQCRSLYLQVINNLIDHRKIGGADRKILLSLKRDILEY